MKDFITGIKIVFSEVFFNLLALAIIAAFSYFFGWWAVAFLLAVLAFSIFIECCIKFGRDINSKESKCEHRWLPESEFTDYFERWEKGDHSTRGMPAPSIRRREICTECKDTRNFI